MLFSKILHCPYCHVPSFHLREGFLRSVQIILQIKEGGLATAGPPCGSFVFLNVYTSGRSAQTPLGNGRAYVKDANKSFA